MRLTLIVTTAAVLTLGLSAAYAADNSAPGGTGVEQSTEGKGATNKDTATMAPMGEKGGANTGMQPGTGVEDSAAGKGATDKQGMMKDDKMGSNMGGASSGTAPGGTGVEKSSEGEGATQKN